MKKEKVKAENKQNQVNKIKIDFNKNYKAIAIVLGIMSALVTCGIAIQIRSVESSSIMTSNDTINNLRAEVLKQQEKYNNLYAALEDAEKQLEKQREESTKNNSELTAVEEQITKSNKLIGLTEVTGSGIILTLDDGKANNYLGSLSDLLIHDLDLINVVNELKNAGAEAISINGQRITTTSSIMCDGNVIMVNGVKIGAPFEIRAIGLPEQLSGLSRPGGYLAALNEYSITTDLKKSNNVTIPKYSGVINFKYVETK